MDDKSEHKSSIDGPFASLSIWRSKLQADVVELPHASSEKFKLDVLLHHSKDCEQAVYGCLKDALCDLNESYAWGLVDEESMVAERERLYGQAAQEINTDKHLVVELARENNCLELYHQDLLQPIQHSLSDMERLGELRFGLLVRSYGHDSHLVDSCVKTTKNVQKCMSTVPGFPVFQFPAVIIFYPIFYIKYLIFDIVFP